MGCVCHDPRSAGLVCPNPRKGATSPGACSAATCHTVNLASITRRRAEQAGPLEDLAKMALAGTMRHRHGPGRWTVVPRPSQRASTQALRSLVNDQEVGVDFAETEEHRALRAALAQIAKDHLPRYYAERPPAHR